MERYPRVKDIFGSLVFDRRAMRERLPRDVYDALVATMEGRGKLDISCADVVALAMRDWAIDNGATHWAHWFHPQTEFAAEKHQSFTRPTADGSPIEVFRGVDLMQGEPDASSFPSAGLRSTFEARGYSAWDTSSPAFIVGSPKGGTLCIPSVFLAFDGTPLDLKTPLLRALDAVELHAMRLLRLFGVRGVKGVHATVGAEQEFFLLDRPRAQLRPDIRFCGRTVIGAQPAKDQRLDHHYLGAIPPRVLAYMEDVERDLARLGVSIATRHNEVARCQFEFAPLFAEANRACDESQIIMETMRKLARKHELRLLFHEKPFHDMNGSGKHVNISLMDSEGRNLLKPSTNQRKNVIFLSFLAGLISGVAEHHGLLRAVTATAGNMYRLGGHEAPPSAISIFLGEALTKVLSSLGEGSAAHPERAVMDLGISKLPSIVAYDGDRNRTSPLAFTGDKFEFRSPGASQSIAPPVTMLLSIWASGLKRIADIMEEKCGGGEPIEAAIAAIGEVTKTSRHILFEGDAYSAEWQEEARRRGLVVADTTAQAIDIFTEKKHADMLREMGVYNEGELEALREIRLESFGRAMEIEMSVLYDMLWEGVLPAISKQLVLERGSLASLDFLGAENFPEGEDWRGYIADLGRFKGALIGDAKRLAAMHAKAADMPSHEKAVMIERDAVPLMESIRAKCDAAELLISADIWPYPIYRNLLSI